MKYVPLIWSAIWRKPMRTTLILLQVAVALALFASLQGMKTGIDQTAAKLAPDQLRVAQSLSSASPLPLVYADQLTSMPGVKAVTYVVSFVGSYQSPTQKVGVEAISKSDVWQKPIPGVLTILPEDLRNLQSSRIGALITPYVAKKYGWRVGERISLTSSTTLQNNGSGTWVFDIVGMATLVSSDHAPIIFVNYDYVDEARALNKGTVSWFYVTVSDPKKAAVVSDRIDGTFANSASQTATQPLNILAQQHWRQMGNLNFVIHAIVSVALVALMFSIATMMMQTVRERTPELAVLKTLGFSDRAVFLLVGADALIVGVAGGIIGLGLATVTFPFAANFLSLHSIPVSVLEVGLIAAVLISLVSVWLPASRAAKLPVISALARR